MDFADIKAFLLAKKKYILAALVLGAAFLFIRQNNNHQVDNSAVLGNKVEQVARKKSSSSFTAGANNSSTAKTVTVDISGAVKKQGVYTLRNGARIDELIKAAGGLKANAQLRNINRAVMLKDQDKVHIPYKGERAAEASVNMAGSTSASTQGEATASSASSNETKVNINTASAADLQKLNGIGEKKAAQIIAYREEKGQFKKIEDLMQVSGIGEKTFAALKDQLAI